MKSAVTKKGEHKSLGPPLLILSRSCLEPKSRSLERGLIETELIKLFYLLEFFYQFRPSKEPKKLSKCASSKKPKIVDKNCFHIRLKTRVILALQKSSTNPCHVLSVPCLPTSEKVSMLISCTIVIFAIVITFT